MKFEQLTQPGPVNMTLPVPAHDAVHLQMLVRVLVGRRWVFSGEWQGKAVYAKVFAGAQAKRYASRDAAGVLQLQDAGLRAPALFWQGSTHFASKPVTMLLYAAIPQARNVAEVYTTIDVQQKKQLLISLSAVLAQQHAAGLCQTDLHLKNFLLSAGEVWSIDGDGIRRQTLSRRQAYRQLAILFSKLQVLDQHAYAAEMLNAYCAARAWQPTLTPQQFIQSAKQLKTVEVERYVHDKIFRNCSDIHWQYQQGEAQAISVAGGLQATTIAELESAIAQGTPLKQGNTCTVSLATLQGQAVVIKRYNIKDPLHAVSRAWRHSRAAASWRNAHRLQYYGLATPQPLLMLERRYWGFRGKAYFVAAYSPNLALSQFFQQTSDKRLRAEAMKQLATLCYQLYLLKLSHGDMKATNLQITNQGQVVVMDLDSMRQHRCAFTALKAHMRDLHRLLQNWQDDTSLYNAMLKSLRVVYADPTPLQKAGLFV